MVSRSTVNDEVFDVWVGLFQYTVNGALEQVTGVPGHGDNAKKWWSAMHAAKVAD